MMSQRRVQRICDLIITEDENILISNSGCDQSIINKVAFFGSALQGGMCSSKL